LLKSSLGCIRHSHWHVLLAELRLLENSNRENEMPTLSFDLPDPAPSAFLGAAAQFHFSPHGDCARCRNQDAFLVPSSARRNLCHLCGCEGKRHTEMLNTEVELPFSVSVDQTYAETNENFGRKASLPFQASSTESQSYSTLAVQIIEAEMPFQALRRPAMDMGKPSLETKMKQSIFLFRLLSARRMQDTARRDGA
jgi:hypothetical protein